MNRFSRVRWGLLVSLCLVAKAFSAGHSVHIQMSKKAVELVSDPALRSILQEYQAQWVIGSGLPDGGYLNGYPYAEISHWSKFHRSYFSRVQKICPPEKLQLAECKKLVSHFMGMVAHGVEDEIYDNLLMSLSDQVDGRGGDHLATSKDTIVDKYALYDYQGAYDVHPTAVSPLDVVYQALKSMPKSRVQRSHLEEGQGNIVAAAVLERQLVNPFSNLMDSRLYPWLRQNYRDGIGGINYTGTMVARVWDYYWAKFKGHDQIEPQFSVYPEPGGIIGLNSSIGRGRFMFIADRPLSYFYRELELQKLMLDGSWQEIASKNYYRPDGYLHAVFPIKGFVAGEQYRAILSYSVDGLHFDRELVWNATAAGIP